MSQADKQNSFSSSLRPDLLDEVRHPIESPTELRACINAHGLYNSFQFVLRLSPEVHRRIAAMPAGIVSGRGLSFEGIQAYSTYLHETVHWWQHIGSTTGLMLSLSYPAQAHANYLNLKSLAASIGPKKSIRRWVESQTGMGGDPSTPAGLANVILNNHYDIEFFRILITNPKVVRDVVEDPLFDCVGHSYATAYANILFTIASTVDEEFAVMPDPRLWQDEFARLRTEKVKGYYFRSGVMAVPFGAHEIFEGQARFCQLQYLHFGSGGAFDWEDARKLGMLNTVYVVAFENFLRIANLEWPSSIDNPIVALFMLVCDIAINPNTGFPSPIKSFNTFIDDIDPGLRFIILSHVISIKCPKAATAIIDYSRAEYLHLAEELTSFAFIDHPLMIGATLRSWRDGSSAMTSLMKEHSTFDYNGRNLPVRVLLSHFLAFNADKLTRPEFFCWPGAWMAGDRVSSESEDIFTRHLALFIDKADDDGIFPRPLSDRDERLVYETFNGFYAINVTYDMARQWIATEGSFKYEYSWLSSSGTPADFKQFADRHFEGVFGVHPDRFELL